MSLLLFKNVPSLCGDCGKQTKILRLIDDILFYCRDCDREEMEDRYGFLYYVKDGSINDSKEIK